jgi:hypothetical protein
MKTVIAQIRTSADKPGRTGIPITVTHTDLPTNDGRRCFKQFSFHQTAIWRVSNVFCSPLWQDPKKYSCRWVIQLVLISKTQK